MSYRPAIAELNAADATLRAGAVGVLYERFFEKFRRYAYRQLKNRSYSGDSMEQATELAMNVFSRLLVCAAEQKWPGDRAAAPWEDEASFEAYWYRALETRAVNACVVCQRTQSVDPQANLNYLNAAAPENEETEVELTEVVAAIHAAAKDKLKNWQLRVIPVFAREYFEVRDLELPMADIYLRVAEKNDLSSPGYVANCWSAGLTLVKQIVGAGGNKAAAELLARAAIAEGFPAPAA